jgi:4-hydroxy-3-methylbut-2-en-1-yl diphosphate reductase
MSGRAPRHPALLLMVPLAIERATVLGLADAKVVPVGMGPRRALLAARRGRRIPAAAVAVTGFCGGLRRDLRPGDVVVATHVSSLGERPGVAEACSSGPLVAALRARGFRRVHAGPVVSSDHIVLTSERERLAATGAVAVDMESSWLRSAGETRPFAVLRVVLDTPSTTMREPAAALRGCLQALTTLRKAAPALVDWARAAGDRRVLLATPRSFCAGAQRAIATVDRALELFGPPVYVRKQIVHNVHVVAELRRRGARFVDSLEEIPPGSLCIFSAHGVSPTVRQAAAARDLRVVDATCPLVAKVHKEARRFAASGYRIVLIGHAGHDEVEGTIGEAPDSTVIVENPEGVDELELPKECRVAYLTQTTLAVDETARIVERLRRRYPGVVGPRSADICYATSNRQDAVRNIARESDLVLVVGSANSSNSCRLVEIAEREGCAAKLIDDETELHPAWLHGRRTIGVTAGASAPQDLVDQVVQALAGMGRLEIEERGAGTEALDLALPAELEDLMIARGDGTRGGSEHAVDTALQSSDGGSAR